MPFVKTQVTKKTFDALVSVCSQKGVSKWEFMREAINEKLMLEKEVNKNVSRIYTTTNQRTRT